MAAFDPATLPGRGIKPLVSLRAHPRLALVVFLVVLLAGIPVVFLKGKPSYSAAATVQVAPRYMKNLRDDGELDFPSNTQYRAFLEQQARSVLRYDIVQDAVRTLDPARVAWRGPDESERVAIDRLRGLITVRTVPDTYMIVVQLDGPSKDGLAEIVNAIVATYVERMRTERVFGADVRVRNLETREAELGAAIKDKTTRRTALALELGVTGFTGKEENPYDRLLADLRSAHADARKKRFEAEARLKAFEARGETDIGTRSVQEAVLIDPGLANLKASLYKRRAEVLVKLAGLTPGHPAFAELDEELRLLEGEIEKQTGALSREVRENLKARYATTLEQARRVEEDLANELAETGKRGSGFANLYNEASTLTLDMDQDRKELDIVRQRLNELAGEQNSFGFVRLVNPALPPEQPFGPGKKKLVLMILAAAFGAGLVAPVARDLLDRRLYTVNDAERLLGIPALGWMVERSDAATRLFGEDLMRRLAGGLINEQQRHGTRVFAFSSVKAGAGVSELALSLGRTLDALGYPALVVEANAFKRDARLRAGAAPGQPGLAAALAGQADAGDCVIPANAELPARVPVGDTGGARHIDRLDRIGELADAWGKDYRFILVDIPPLLLSADAEILARSLEHLILVAEAGGITSGELRRAGRQLEKLAPSAVGVVVNRVCPFKGGGYLDQMLMEYLSGRKVGEYFTTPAWRVALQARLAGLRLRRPRLPALRFRRGGGA